MKGEDRGGWREEKVKQKDGSGKAPACGKAAKV